MEESSVESLSSYVTLASIDAAIQIRADKIDQIIREQTVLRRRRNTFALISRLPEEILCEIFLDVVRLLNTSLTERSDWPQQWLTVSHICHHWREVLLAFSQFWDHVVLQRPTELLTMFLERSGQSPLTIAGLTLQRGIRDVRANVLVDALAHQAHRIQWLESFTPRLRVAELLANVMAGLGTTFSTLKTFKIVCELEGLPPNLFTSKTMPQLRHLICFNPSIFFLQSICNCPLTTLQVRSCIPAQSVVVWTGIIKHFKALQILDLADGSPLFKSQVDGAPDASACTPVHLPKLQTLRLSGSYCLSSWARFIECCTFPRTTKVRLEFGDDRYPFLNEAHLISSLSSYASRLGLFFASCYTSSHDVFTLSYDVVALQIDLWEEVIPAAALHEATDPAWQLLFPACPTQHVFTSFLSEFSLPKLHSFSVSATQGTPYKNGFAQLDSHPTIRELAFSGRPSTAGFLDTARQPSILPNLERLVLRDVAFKKHAEPARQRKERSLACDLEEMLRIRKDQGVPVKELRIIDARLLQDYDMKKIEDVVSEVEWSYAGSKFVHCHSCEEDRDGEE